MTRARSLDILHAALSIGAMLIGGPSLQAVFGAAALAVAPSRGSLR